MNINETKKYDLNPEIKKELKKSKLEVLTNENDFLVKNLKKAGWFSRAFKYFPNNNSLNFLLKQNNVFLNDHQINFNFIKYKISIKYTI